jgi:hypothetical protein
LSEREYRKGCCVKRLQSSNARYSKILENRLVLNTQLLYKKLTYPLLPMASRTRQSSCKNASSRTSCEGSTVAKPRCIGSRPTSTLRPGPTQNGLELVWLTGGTQQHACSSRRVVLSHRTESAGLWTCFPLRCLKLRKAPFENRACLSFRFSLRIEQSKSAYLKSSKRHKRNRLHYH